MPEWNLGELDSTGNIIDTPLITAELCLSPGIGNCIEDEEIIDQETCECFYYVGAWEPSQGVEAIWHSSVWIDAIWDPTTSDDYSCAADCSETYEECCENSNGTWDPEYASCDNDTNWDGTYCWGNVAVSYTHLTLPTKA